MRSILGLVSAWLAPLGCGGHFSEWVTYCIPERGPGDLGNKRAHRGGGAGFFNLHGTEKKRDVGAEKYFFKMADFGGCMKAGDNELGVRWEMGVCNRVFWNPWEGLASPSKPTP